MLLVFLVGRQELVEMLGICRSQRFGIISNLWTAPDYRLTRDWNDSINQSINQSIYSSSPMLEVAGNSILSMYNIVSLKVERNDNIAGSHHAVYYNLYI